MPFRPPRPHLPSILHALALALAACGSATPAGVNLTTDVASKPGTTSGLQYRRLSNPPRTVVSDTGGNWVATYTDGARAVVLAGGTRTFAEPTGTTYTVTHDRWVRLLDRPFTGTVDEVWLKDARASTAPDVLATATQYVQDAPDQFDADGVRYAGDADYGPLLEDGTRQEGSDFNDYLGVSWAYAGESVDQPEAHQFGSLDCSGFTRIVFGYRGTLPLSLGVDAGALPRRAWMQYEQAAGVVTIRNTGKKAIAYDRLQPGDLVFFDASADDGTAIDHVGVYLGVDDGGNHRFVSSRKGANGPTLGDYRGRSVLNPVSGVDGLYSRSFRAARRL